MRLVNRGIFVKMEEKKLVQPSRNCEGKWIQVSDALIISPYSTQVTCTLDFLFIRLVEYKVVNFKEKEIIPKE